MALPNELGVGQPKGQHLSESTGKFGDSHVSEGQQAKVPQNMDMKKGIRGGVRSSKSWSI